MLLLLRFLPQRMARVCGAGDVQGVDEVALCGAHPFMVGSKRGRRWWRGRDMVEWGWGSCR